VQIRQFRLTDPQHAVPHPTGCLRAQTVTGVTQQLKLNMISCSLSSIPIFRLQNLQVSSTFARKQQISEQECNDGQSSAAKKRLTKDAGFYSMDIIQVLFQSYDHSVFRHIQCLKPYTVLCHTVHYFFLQ
jgi:hypothetical protein